MTELSEQVEHVDQPEVAATEEAEPVVVVEEPIVIINLPISKLIKKDQLEHGVRHRDYAQYRKYCTNRARRFRQALNFKLGDKRRVTPKKVTTAEVARSPNFLQMLVTNIEHDYAYALELKQVENVRARHHMRNKLRKAAKRAHAFCALLDELGEARCDARTMLEGRAYANFIIANFEFEQQQWESCLTRFTAAQTIYTSLAETLPADEAPVYAEMATELEPNLRYCQYNLGEKADQSLLSGAQSELTQGKLSDLLARTKVEEAENLNMQEWRGRKIAIRNEKVRLFLLNYREFCDEVERVAGDDEKLEKYGEIIMECTIGRYNIIARALTKPNEYSRVYEQVIQYCSEFIKKCNETGHDDLGQEFEHNKMVFTAACRFYQAKQAAEIGKMKEAGVLVLKAKQLIGAASPKNDICIEMHQSIGKLVQSTGASIQAAILLPKADNSQLKTKKNVEGAQLQRKLVDFGSQYGKIDFPPKLRPVPAKPVLFDICGNKMLNYPQLADRVEKNQEAKKGGWGLSSWWGGGASK